MPEKLPIGIQSFEKIRTDNFYYVDKTPYIAKLAKELIWRISDKYESKVVVLIDEYDKPILDRIENKEIALELREVLKNFYGVLKPLDTYVKFVFITGVSKSSKVSLFSGLNQLNDITIYEKYSSICDYTQKEFEEKFKDILYGTNLEEVRSWYKGYSWLGEPFYNPFDILLYLDEKDFRPYWFETGTPTFLIKLMAKRKYYLPNLGRLKLKKELIGRYDVDATNPENLLFQTGYLTISEKFSEEGDIRHSLRLPNTTGRYNQCRQDRHDGLLCQ